jgi:lysyl-tRNA synthetase class 2
MNAPRSSSELKTVSATAANAAAEWRPLATFETLRRRNELLAKVRRFFAERGVLEVETPVLQGGCNLDPCIQPYRVETHDGPRFLPTSPEHPLKRLVAAGYGPVWTLAPAFRHGERGPRHMPEFRMLEWYRPGWDDWRLMQEVLELLNFLTGWGLRHEILGYRWAFRHHVGIDPAFVVDAQLEAMLGADWPATRGDRAAALDLLLATRVEPYLGRGKFSILTDYPAHLAAQAKLRMDEDDRPVAARFEIYREGIELANGYSELTDPAELGARLGEELARREPTSGLVRDARYEQAIAAGLGDCAGVAIGFDRLVMLALGLKEVGESMAFPWPRA